MVEKSFSSEYLLKKGFVEFCSLENSLFYTAENCNKVIVSKLYSGERDVMKQFIKNIARIANAVQVTILL